MDFPIYPLLICTPRLSDFRKISRHPTIKTPRLLGTDEYQDTKADKLDFWKFFVLKKERHPHFRETLEDFFLFLRKRSLYSYNLCFGTEFGAPNTSQKLHVRKEFYRQVH